MPQLTQVLLKGPGRRPQGLPVPFQQVLPLRLKNRVSGKASKGTNVACLHEMNMMLACFKDSDFDQVRCRAEIEAFRKCADGHQKELWKRNRTVPDGLLSMKSGSGTVDSVMLNKALYRNRLPKRDD